MSEGKKYVKVYCKKSKKYGLVTVEKTNGVDRVTNFYEIDDETAKSVNTAFEGELPDVSGHLKPCVSTGKRTPRSSDSSRQCAVKRGELWYQCLFCSGLEICRSAERTGGADIYFLMDQSGSMEYHDRRAAANAVKRMVQTLSGMNNTYSFVAWGSTAGYIFKKETNMSKMNSALSLYESGKTEHSGSTDAANAFRCIQPDVASSHRPVRIIFVTDGYLDSDEEALVERNRLLGGQRNVEILAIGVDGAKQETLKKIGTVAAFSKVIGSSAALTSTFEQIAAVLKKKGNNF
ncbi:MAG: VWA domain-containing protein [Clostridia bacterium]|nr:VWA domain-containing protein [Clostridia bacterium]